MDFPGADLIKDPFVDLHYEINIEANPENVWPWIQPVGYHYDGWYIDTRWDKFEQKYFWPLVAPSDARGVYKPAEYKIFAEYPNIFKGDVVPDGPPDER